jgi:glycosyltransferase involved in cell wall biosynthesis
MRNLKPKISIVIPAYNEESHIGACLKAISKLELKPYEVIVVDNMSTDKTAEIARSFAFARVIQETKQGVVYARDRGFNAARGDIIGRIDCDTLLPSNWTAKLANIFQDDSVDAVSGGIHFYDIGLQHIIDGVDAYWRAWVARKMAVRKRIFLFGSNMAIRRSAWLAVRGRVCHKKGIHEDLDLSLHLSWIDLKVVFDPNLLANVSIRRIDSSFFEVVHYCFVSPKTYIKHKANEHWYAYPIIAIVLVNYVLLRILFRAFDEQTQKLTLKTFLTSHSTTRVNPADFIQY